MYSKKNNINERSIIIPINKRLSRFINETKTTEECSLNKNFFDPSKSSPPNNFMDKLIQRMSVYNSVTYKDTNENNLVIE